MEEHGHRAEHNLLSANDEWEKKSQQWEEEKAQRLVQIRAYKRENDTIKSALTQEQERATGLEGQLAGLQDEIEKLIMEREDLEVQVTTLGLKCIIIIIVIHTPCTCRASFI